MVTGAESESKVCQERIAVANLELNRITTVLQFSLEDYRETQTFPFLSDSLI